MAPDPLRQSLRAQRRSLRPGVGAGDAAELFLEAVSTRTTLVSPSRIALYVARDGELDPAPLAVALRNSGHVTALPVIDASTLRFAEVDEATAVAGNRFGIDEPVGGTGINAQDLHVVVVPMVGFDLTGNRLGHGHGYYDRAFAFRRNSPAPPLLVGYAHDEQQVEAIAANATDVAMDLIVTPTRVIDPAPGDS